MSTHMPEKQNIITEYRKHEKDTGSAQVQIAIMTRRINQLTDHFKTHKKDHHSRYGLIKIVGKRRKLLNYIKKYDPEKYRELLGKLDLRK